MKIIINLLIVTSIVLTSCSTVEFKEIVPKEGNELTKFPKELIGKYIDIQNKDTLIINQTDFNYGEKETLFHLSGNLSDENTVLKKSNDFFILNAKPNNDKNWGIIPFKYKNDKLFVYYLILDTETKDKKEARKYRKEKLERLSLITNVEAIKDTTNQLDNYLINPTDKEMEQILNGSFFVKIIEFEKLKN
ncbi:MAG: hypothetical protein U9N51_07490 [Bacteroidota bacterium]|nr:hypothetical protein [Bacteroidota bacterium]